MSQRGELFAKWLRLQAGCPFYAQSRALEREAIFRPLADESARQVLEAAIRARLMRILRAAAILISAVSAANAQVLEHPGPGAADPYATWRDGTGLSCCSGRDCAPAEPCRTETGQDGWLELGRCWPLDETKRVQAPREVWESGYSLHVCRIPSWIDGEIVAMRQLCWDRADAM